MHLSDCFMEVFTYVRLLVDSPEMADAEYAVVREDMNRLIERMDDKFDESPFSTEKFEQARFAVFAWVDETVLCSSWSGTRQWLAKPLQREYYGTTNAGEQFFERLRMLLGENIDPVDESLFSDFEGDGVNNAKDSSSGSAGVNDVIEVYALCLSLGYTGMYFSDQDSERLAKLRTDCVARIMGRQQNGEELSAFPLSYGSGTKAARKSGYRRILDPVSLIFFILPVLVVTGIFFAYRGLLEYSLNLWLG
ncbi:DotU family type IV/VI secretion system protein [Maridesulfovibrio zosterae]|uniref:DotU family type IV/VI secretion system protein n=1 Tax=Maridesulfovibrio zosterae TaxID=82171 RepID=UPI0004286381|nr:DotU family type IV/VI secretion system protein [Maridesulfovibrio zosterae]